ncbi:hypothetical protein HK101_001027 [Irineochytrium annulatum]|nr:hypothetical protein HK101_001027 [Irineochytrium annulatum]
MVGSKSKKGGKKAAKSPQKVIPNHSRSRPLAATAVKPETPPDTQDTSPAEASEDENPRKRAKRANGSIAPSAAPAKKHGRKGNKDEPELFKPSELAKTKKPVAKRQRENEEASGRPRKRRIQPLAEVGPTKKDVYACTNDSEPSNDKPDWKSKMGARRPSGLVEEGAQAGGKTGTDMIEEGTPMEEDKEDSDLDDLLGDPMKNILSQGFKPPPERKPRTFQSKIATPGTPDRSDTTPKAQPSSATRRSTPKKKKSWSLSKKKRAARGSDVDDEESSSSSEEDDELDADYEEAAVDTKRRKEEEERRLRELEEKEKHEKEEERKRERAREREEARKKSEEGGADLEEEPPFSMPASDCEEDEALLGTGLWEPVFTRKDKSPFHFPARVVGYSRVRKRFHLMLHTGDVIEKKREKFYTASDPDYQDCEIGEFLSEYRTVPDPNYSDPQLESILQSGVISELERILKREVENHRMDALDGSNFRRLQAIAFRGDQILSVDQLGVIERAVEDLVTRVLGEDGAFGALASPVTRGTDDIGDGEVLMPETAHGSPAVAYSPAKSNADAPGEEAGAMVGHVTAETEKLVADMGLAARRTRLCHLVLVPEAYEMVRERMTGVRGDADEEVTSKVGSLPKEEWIQRMMALRQTLSLGAIMRGRV